MRLSVDFLLLFSCLLFPRVLFAEQIAEQIAEQTAEQIGVEETIHKQSIVRVGVSLQEAATIVVHLHGYGDNAHNNALLGKYIIDVQTNAFIIPVATHKMKEGRYSWFKENNSDAEEVVERVHLLLDEIRRQNPDAHIVIGGFSQGAIISLRLAARKNIPVDAVYIWSGGHPPKAYPHHKSMPPIFISHGRKDGVLPIAPMKEAGDALKKLSVPITWYPYDAQHNLSKNLFSATEKFILKTAQEKRQKK